MVSARRTFSNSGRLAISPSFRGPGNEKLRALAGAGATAPAGLGIADIAPSRNAHVPGARDRGSVVEMIADAATRGRGPSSVLPAGYNMAGSGRRRAGQGTDTAGEGL